jgi:hypothetical protein
MSRTALMRLASLRDSSGVPSRRAPWRARNDAARTSSSQLIAIAHWRT